MPAVPSGSTTARDLGAIKRRALSAVWVRLLVIVSTATLLFGGLSVVAGVQNGVGRETSRSPHSYDLGIASADAVAVVIGLILLVTTLNIALASLDKPASAADQIRAETWRATLSVIAVVAAVCALALGESQLTVSDLDHHWATSGTCLVIGLLGAAVAAAGSWRATFDSVQHLTAIRLEEQATQIRRSIDRLKGRMPAPLEHRTSAWAAFVALSMWLTLLATAVPLLGDERLRSSASWRDELGLLLAAALIIFPSLAVLVGIQSARLKGNRLITGVFILTWVALTALPIILGLTAVVAGSVSDQGSLLAYTVTISGLPIVAWLLRRRGSIMAGCLDDLSLRSLTTELKYIEAQQRQSASRPMTTVRAKRRHGGG